MIGMDGTKKNPHPPKNTFLQNNVDKHNKANKKTHRQPTTIQQSNKPINQQLKNRTIPKSQNLTNQQTNHKPQACCFLLISIGVFNLVLVPSWIFLEKIHPLFLSHCYHHQYHHNKKCNNNNNIKQPPPY